MLYQFFHDYILSKVYIETLTPNELRKLRHNFYALSENAIRTALDAFDPFPVELKQFYQEVGFGYFHCHKERTNRILDPYSLIMMNRLEDRFACDVELKRALVDGHLVFFQTFSHQYLTIDRYATDDENPVYYKKREIANSLHRFLHEYSTDRTYLSSLIKEIDKDEIKLCIPQATLRNTFIYILKTNSR